MTTDLMSKPLGFTRDERAYRAKRDVWRRRIQGHVGPDSIREFYRLYDAMLRSGDEAELKAWIQAYNRGSVK
jgi:hypothetical protein